MNAHAWGQNVFVKRLGDNFGKGAECWGRPRLLQYFLDAEACRVLVSHAGSQKAVGFR